MNAWERDVVREAVREATIRSRRMMERRTIPPEALEAFPDGSPEKEWALLVKRDTADVFVDYLLAALRRDGAFLLFLE